MPTLVKTTHFERSLRTFTRQHQHLKRRVAEVLRVLEVDPSDHRLRLHPLGDDLAGQHAVRVTYSHRVTLTLALDADRIYLLDIGTHDEVHG